MNYRKLFLVLVLTYFLSIFPVPSVEAKTETFYPIADTYVSSVSSNSNYGGLSRLEIANNKLFETGSFSIGFVMFDLSGIPADAIIEYARLKLYCLLLTETHIIGVHFCLNNNWEEYKLTWDNQPNYNKTGSVLTIAKDNAWYVWEKGPTEFVKKVLTTTDKKLTMVIVSHDQHTLGSLWFCSRDQDYFWMKEYLPNLVISYTMPSPPSTPSPPTSLTTAIMIAIVIAVIAVTVLIVIVREERKRKHVPKEGKWRKPKF